MIFGHLEVLHSKFNDPTISNLGDQSKQTNRQTNKQTDKQTNRQTDIVIYILIKLECKNTMYFECNVILSCALLQKYRGIPLGCVSIGRHGDKMAGME